EAMNNGGTSSAILNAANEIAVNEFLQQRIKFTDIAKVIETVLENVTQTNADSIEVILAADRDAREYAMNTIKDIAA
ncbi:MAG: 1-deoxy-D-xylulose-5-phosphate reductoisomerase, partial [Proteobacteria bacterium]|nr:1-deoxy-D-xylulose-5-phosphate reductoisomerase [Pseudomonadota bacterium]